MSCTRAGYGTPAACVGVVCRAGHGSGARHACRIDCRGAIRQGRASGPVRTTLGREPSLGRARGAHRAAFGRLCVLRQCLQRRRVHAWRRLPPVHGRSYAVDRGGVVFGQGVQVDPGGCDLAWSPVRSSRFWRHRVMAGRHAGVLSRLGTGQPRRHRHGLSHAADPGGRGCHRQAAPVGAAHGGCLG